MPDYEAAARRAARKHGVDPDVFVAQLKQESGLRPGLTSSKGAQGIAQFIPSTAASYGVNLHDGRVSDDLDGAARYMRDNLKRTGGDYAAALSIYNSGHPDAYKDPRFAEGQTYNYVKTILGSAKPRKVKAPKTSSALESAQQTTVQTSPGVDNSEQRRQLVGQFLQQGGIKNSNAVLALAGQYGQAQDVAPTYGTQQASPSTGGSVSKAKVLKQAGAQNALSWAESKVGQASSRETGGENRGRLADYANSRFGMRGQPWCAMFTSLAVTKGGAPKSARTASVAEVRRKALAGDGYQKGLVKQARPGDLVLFGDRHIGMVKSVDGDRITYVGGNQSDNVTQAETTASGVDVVRPKYGSRK